MIDVVSLIKIKKTKNSYGQLLEQKSEREVFAEVGSISSKEFFDGGRNGLNPSYKIAMFSYDYENEPIVKVDGKEFGIYRTYRHGDTIELYAEGKSGLQ